MHYNGRSNFKEMAATGYPQSGEIRWDYFKGDKLKDAQLFRIQMLSWTADCCRVLAEGEEYSEAADTQESRLEVPLSQGKQAACQIVPPDKAHPDFQVVPYPMDIPAKLPDQIVKVLELCPLCGQPNRKSSKENQKLHLLQSHAQCIFSRPVGMALAKYEEVLYTRVQEVISFCNVLWQSHLLPVHLALFIG
ncbi:uncharacterized protein LOC117647834 [Thrips palmi]|uniref:Uncharacterized protein LOC117647834 n=1 Tax=Thrips palmi TaxID=161013 RepID=A0A6P8ZBX4_THRPL|nr:uncharacterized protein LOC117647834 [Thrips palmi]